MQIEKITWMLLSFPAQLDLYIKDFKVSGKGFCIRDARSEECKNVDSHREYVQRGLRQQLRRQTEQTIMSLQEAKIRFAADNDHTVCC